MDDQQRGTALMAAGYGFGAAGVLAPRLVASAFGMRDISDEYVALMRTFSTRNLALARAFQMVSHDDKMRKEFFTVAAAMFSADTVMAVVTAATGRTSKRGALSLGVVTAVLAAIAASGAAAD